MMKTRSNWIVVLSLVILAAGCKKQDLQKENGAGAGVVTQHAKAWVESQTSAAGYQNFLLGQNLIEVPQKILWHETKEFPGTRTSITPVSFTSVVGTLPVNKYLVTETDDAGRVQRGNYYIVLTEKKEQSPSSEVIITPELFNSKTVPENFKGAIIKYDLNNNKVLSKHYEGGVLTGKDDNLVVRKSKNQVPVENTAPLPEGCSYITIDWYWQTWVNGVLVYEEYLFSSQEIYCQGSGGGGGGGGVTPPTDLEMCQAALASIVSSTTSANQLVSNEIESESPLTRTRLYSWKCVKNIGWWVVAYDKGVQKRIATNKPWTWLSLENLSVAKQGTTVSFGGEVTATKVTSQSVLGISHAIMYIVVNIKTTVAKNAVSLTDERDISSHFTYYVDTAPIPGF